MTTKNLHFKWTVSRGRDTYGYNICTLLVDGEVKGRCMGGGYDMQGTAFAQWLENAYPTELIKFAFDNTKSAHIPARTYQNNGSVVRVYDVPGYYGITVHANFTGKGKSFVHLDGACGFSSMERIAEGIGIKLQWNKESNRYKNHTFYTAILG